jgi:hypothetical protein
MDERTAKVNRFTAGWMGYFQLADTPRVFQELDKWFRRGMRQEGMETLRDQTSQPACGGYQ